MGLFEYPLLGYDGADVYAYTGLAYNIGSWHSKNGQYAPGGVVGLDTIHLSTIR